MIVILVLITAIISQVILSSTSIPRPSTVISTSSSRALIDFEMFDELQAPFKNVDEKELMMAFGLYMEAAGFEEVTANYAERVQNVLEKRLQDTLILK